MTIFNRLCMALVGICLYSGMAVASDFKLIPPVTNEDGTPIYATLGYKFKCGNQSGNYDLIKDAGALQPGTDGICLYGIGEVIPSDGNWYCVATAYYVWHAANESAPSNEIFFVVRDGVIPNVAPGRPSLEFRL